MTPPSKNSFLFCEFVPQVIFVEKKAVEYSYYQEIKSRLDHFSPEYVFVDNDLQAIDLLKKKKKRHLFLGVNRGSFVRKKTFGQDCTSFEDAYCLDHVTGCHFACIYCYLHSYLKKDPLVRIFVNIEDMFEELDHVFESQNRVLFVSTGELSDSLLFEPITHLTKYLIPFLKKRPSLFMEFRSKSGNTSFIERTEPLSNLCFTWSLSPEKVVKEYELKTASLDQRILALKMCQKSGLSTGIIIDPMIHYEGWKEDYPKMISHIAREIDLQKIDRLFVGSFRYRKKMDQDIQNKFPKTKLFTGEFVLARDGKYRYYKPIREEMYRQVRNSFAIHGRPISLSMEFPETWSKLIKKS